MGHDHTPQAQSPDHILQQQLLLPIPAQGAQDPAAAFHGQVVMTGFCPGKIPADPVHLHRYTGVPGRQVGRYRLLIHIRHQILQGILQPGCLLHPGCVPRDQVSLSIRLRTTESPFVIAGIQPGLLQFFHQQSGYIRFPHIRSGTGHKQCSSHIHPFLS